MKPDRPASAVWPIPGMDARVALATSMAASPGVYAVLLGSGISSAAGIKTGFQVVQDLVRTVALAEGLDLGEHDDDPARWWIEQTGDEPRYDHLVTRLASTDLDRRALLRRYFDPPGIGAAHVQPTAAHLHLGRLVADGRVRVVITTNFDQLTERAIEAAGVSPQVIDSVSGIRGMVPLQHARATVLKPHGDFANSSLRNTPEELATYEGEWVVLLNRVFEEYGLVVTGWSAAWDVALTRTLQQTVSRRYPTFWTSRGRLTDQAGRLVAVREAELLKIPGADEFFVDLQARLDRIEAAAARRGPFRFRSDWLVGPESRVPDGWALSPLLRTTVVATIGGMGHGQPDLIQRDDRERMVRKLTGSSLTQHLSRLREELTPVAADAGLVVTTPRSVPDGDWLWHRTPGHHQTGSTVGLRWGGSAQRGVGALCRVALPPSGRGGDTGTVAVDVATSAEGRLSVVLLAQQVGTAIESAAIDLPVALEPLLPADAAVVRLDVRISADADDGRGFSRPNTLEQRIDWDFFGPQTRALGSSIGVSIEVNQLITEADLVKLVVKAFERMVIEAGFDDPGEGVARLRQELSGGEIEA